MYGGGAVAKTSNIFDDTWGLEYSTETFFSFLQSYFGKNYITMSVDPDNSSYRFLTACSYRGNVTYSDDNLNATLGLLQPQNYGLASEIITQTDISTFQSAFSSSFTGVKYAQLSELSEYGADYSYNETFEEAGVTMVSATTIVDVIVDEYTITEVVASDSSGNELTVTIDGQKVTVDDPNYVSGDIITIKIYISLNPEVITNFDDFLDTNNGAAKLSNSVEDVNIEVASPKLIPNTSNYTVKYIDKCTNEEIVTMKTEENIAVNTQISVEDEIIEIEGYTYDYTSINSSTDTDILTVSSNESENIIEIYYSYNSEVVVQYINKATDEVIYTYNLEGLEGEEYAVTYEEQEGYIVDERNYPYNEEGTYTKETIYVTYYIEEPVDITITKVSQEDENNILSGVEFSLYKLICEDSSHEHDTDDDLIDTEDYDTTCWELVGQYATDSNGELELTNLPITGNYRLVETKTIENYLLPTGQWKIEFDYDDNLDESLSITIDDVTLQITAVGNPPALSLQTVNGEDVLYLYNSVAYDVPTTGGDDTNNFYLMGILITLSGVFVLTIRKKSKCTIGKFNSLRQSVNSARNIIDNWDKKK